MSVHMWVIAFVLGALWAVVWWRSSQPMMVATLQRFFGSDPKVEFCRLDSPIRAAVYAPSTLEPTIKASQRTGSGPDQIETSHSTRKCWFPSTPWMLSWLIMDYQPSELM